MFSICITCAIKKKEKRAFIMIMTLQNKIKLYLNKQLQGII